MKILHISPFGAGFNIGNFAITRGIHRWIHDIYPTASIVNIPATGRLSYLTGLTKSSVHFANQYCDAVLVGGGNLIENNEIDIDLNALGSLQVPMSLFSISTGRIYNRHGRLSRRTDTMPDDVLAHLLSSCKQALARDLATRDKLASISPEKTLLGGCPTLFLDKIQSANSFVHSYSSEKTAYLSIRNPEQMNIPVNHKKLLGDLIHDLLNLMKLKFGNVVILCHDLRDIPFATSFSNDVDFYYTPNVLDYLLALQNAEIVISFRIHASLPSYALGTNFINISYDERALSLMKTIGLESWDINLITDDVMTSVKDRVSSLGRLDISDNFLIKEFYNIQDEFMKNIF